jgi:hypothetical protein
MRHDHLPHALLTTFTQQHKSFTRSRMSGRQHETVFGDEADDSLHLWKQCPSLRHRDEGARFLREANLILGVEGRHPDHATPAASDACHVVDGSGIDTTDCQIQRDAAKYLQIRHHLSYEIGRSRGRLVMILEHDRAHPARLGELGDVDGMNRSRSIVGIAVDVNVDRARQRPRRSRRALRETDGHNSRSQYRRTDHSTHHLPPCRRSG